MSPAEPSLNLELVKHIVYEQYYQSRYDIDLALIKAGYDPVEIETAWGSVLSGSYRELLRQNKSVSPTISKKLIIFGSVISIILLIPIATVAIIYLSLKPALPDPLPDYPDGIKTNLQIRLPETYSETCHIDEEAFSGTEYKVFSTHENKPTVFTFYQKVAYQRGLVRQGWSEDNNTVCFSGDIAGARGTGATGVLVMKYGEARKNGIVPHDYPGVETETNLVVVLQGYSYRTLG